MIPKVLHFCWFGNNKYSETILKCMGSWKKHCPDYDIIKWDEKNFNINCNTFVKKAYKDKKWAFVSDYARFDILYNYGGIYIDTDVELVKNTDDFLHEACFMGFERKGSVAPGLILGAEKEHAFLQRILIKYSKISYEKYSTVCHITTDALVDIGLNKNKNIIQRLDNITIYPQQYFRGGDVLNGEKLITQNTFSIHHYEASWVSTEEKNIQKKYLKIYKKFGYNIITQIIAGIICRVNRVCLKIMNYL